MTAPSEYRSERLVRSRLCTCSGDMYEGLPAMPSIREISESDTSAIPKSMMRTSLSCVSMMFEGLDVAVNDPARVRVVQHLGI